MKRKYIKKNCDYWGHIASFIHEAIDEKTKETIAYYGICQRCGERIFMSTKGKKVDNATLVHLADVTLQDLPEIPIDLNANYSICEIYKK
ncbi:MAG TPA: hypothetical protein ENH82_16670 [bacterium]|nr:hypothetical protein [bacterium]